MAHRETLNKLGVVTNLNKVIQELEELKVQLQDYKLYYINHQEPLNFKDILEERCDVGNCLEKLDVFFGYNEDGVESIMNDKMQRTLDRLHIGRSK